ncbi:hypothetical protein LCGC14_1376820 [marine sediment metagenome]|uniref:Uncharacterized protein n=1 Tax=marine sediment metagenome TaxID=412755 RepID=A0A0F9N5U6_9ZZZZ
MIFVRWHWIKFGSNRRRKYSDFHILRLNGSTHCGRNPPENAKTFSMANGKICRLCKKGAAMAYMSPEVKRAYILKAGK